MRVEKDRLVFGEGVVFPIEQILVDHPDDPFAQVTSFNNEQFPWITLWFYPLKNGVLNCDICDFAPKFPKLGKLPTDFSNVRKIVLFHDSAKISELANYALKEAVPRPSPPVMPAPPLPDFLSKPVAWPEPPRKYTQQIKFAAPLERFTFSDGAAEIGWTVRFEKSRGSQHVCFRIENRFFSSKLNCIRPYLAKALGGKPVEVQARVHVCKGKATIEEIKAPALDRISSELLSQVRFNYVKGELKNRSGKRITTARRFFGKLSEAGFDESDADFVADIVRAKNVKHSPQIEYLAGRHDGSQIRLRLIRDPFSFLFFIPGVSGCVFAWETLDGTDATYLWRLMPLAHYLDGNREELKKSLNEVECAIDIIHASGRNDYLKKAPENFRRIFHDYDDENGFEHWQQEIDQVL